MRGVGRSCRGQGHVFVKRVRQTEQQLLACGEPIQRVALKAKERLDQTLTRREAQRQRLTLALTTAMSHHADLRQHSTRLTQGKKLRHCHLIKADDLTLAPMLHGKRHWPAQWGRKPGIASAPATGLILAHLVPQGNPREPRDGLPLRDTVHSAIARVRPAPKPPRHSVASALGFHDPCLRPALHARGLLTVGLPKTMEPINPQPSAQDVRPILKAAGFNRQRTPPHVH